MENKENIQEMLCSLYDAWKKSNTSEDWKHYCEFVFENLKLWVIKTISNEPKFRSSYSKEGSESYYGDYKEIANKMWVGILGDLQKRYNPHQSAMSTYFSPIKLVSYVTNAEKTGPRRKYVAQESKKIRDGLASAGITEDPFDRNSTLTAKRISQITGISVKTIETIREELSIQNGYLADEADGGNNLHSNTPTPEQAFIDKEEKEELLSCIESLKESERVLISWVYYENYTDAMILSKLKQDDFYKKIGYTSPLTKQGIEEVLNRAYRNMKRKLKKQRYNDETLSKAAQSYEQAPIETIFDSFEMDCSPIMT